MAARDIPQPTGPKRFEQFEVWELRGERWELVATFTTFEPAAAVASNRNKRMRLVHVVYENGKPISSETYAEIGNIRKEP
jgi:hypothetical protein